MKRFPFLRSADVVTIAFIVSLSILEILFASRIERWVFFVSMNVLICGFIYYSAQYTAFKKAKSNIIIQLFRDWYLVPNILFIYTQASSITYTIHQRDYDSILIIIDQWLFGANPTEWIYQFAHPFITEILQIAYSSYYLFFIALFFELYRRNDKTAFHFGASLVVYGFYLSYIGYLLFPAIGPRFTLHNFFATETELPGIFLTPYLREIVNAGGGVPVGVINPAALVHRDAFPSGHTQLTLVLMYVAFTTKTHIRWWLFVGGSLLIISTVYMRYHYVIDVLTGIFFFIFTIWSGKKITRWWNDVNKENDS
ncbi:MAG: phosphatase PAP2 family protein [Bacteroidota bacterium]